MRDFWNADVALTRGQKVIPQNYGTDFPASKTGFPQSQSQQLYSQMDNFVNRAGPQSSEQNWNVRAKYVPQASRDNNNSLGNLAFIGADKSQGNVGQVHVPEEYFEFAQRELDNNFYNDFRKFTFAQINLASPLKRKYYQQKFPAFFSEAKKNQMFQWYLNFKYNEIKTNPEMTKDDMMILYMIEQGFDLSQPWMPESVVSEFQKVYGAFYGRDSANSGRNLTTETPEQLDLKDPHNEYSAEINRFKGSETATFVDPGAPGPIYRAKKGGQTGTPGGVSSQKALNANPSTS